MPPYAKPIKPGPEARRRALATVRAAGCTCPRPGVELAAWHSGGDVQRMNVWHDEGCPAIEQGAAIGIFTTGGRG